MGTGNIHRRYKSVDCNQFSDAHKSHSKIKHEVFRSSEAQNAHTKIMGYIADKVDEQTLITTIQNLSQNALVETSANGYTHLHDVYHFSFTHTTNNSAKKCSKIANLLFTKAISLEDGSLSFLLTKRSNCDVTPLHDILISGDSDTLDFVQFHNFLAGARQS